MAMAISGQCHCSNMTSGYIWEVMSLLSLLLCFKEVMVKKTKQLAIKGHTLQSVAHVPCADACFCSMEFSSVHAPTPLPYPSSAASINGEAWQKEWA